MSLAPNRVPEPADPVCEILDEALTAKRQRRIPKGVGVRLTRRVPMMHERTSMALGGMFGPLVKEVVFCVGNSMQRGHYPVAVAKLILERVLPASRPIQLDLPQIDCGAALIEAETKITDAMNAGTISPNEARTLQEWAKQSWRSRRVAAVQPKRK